MDEIARVQRVQGDFTDAAVRKNLRTLVAGGRVDVVLSYARRACGASQRRDMAPRVAGIREQDHVRSAELVREAVRFARDELSCGGSFAAKLLQGRHGPELCAALQKMFHKVAWFKPEASRAASSEIYIVGLRRRGPPAAQPERQSGQ